MTYLKGDSPRISAAFKDHKNSLAEPDLIMVSIYDPSGALLVNSAGMTRDEDYEAGVYFYVFSGDAMTTKGEYQVFVRCVRDGYPSVAKTSFEVYE